MLTSKQRAFLRAKANQLDTIFHVGKDGIGENSIRQLDDVLRARELIKVKVLDTAECTAKEASVTICERTGAEAVQVIGARIVLFRRNEKEPIIELPRG